MLENFFGKKDVDAKKKAREEIVQLERELAVETTKVLGEDKVKEMKKIFEQQVRDLGLTFDLHTLDALTAGMRMFRSIQENVGNKGTEIAFMCLAVLVTELRDRRDEKVNTAQTLPKI